MISYFQALVLGLLQGISELFPVSSLGHSVILPQLLGWKINQSDPFFLTFLVATHFATALVLTLFFWRDWIRILKGMGRTLAQRQISADDWPARLGWLLVLGTIPAGVVGLLLQDKLQKLFGVPLLAAIFLAVNGLILYAAELLRRKAPPDQILAERENKSPDQRIGRLSWGQAFKIGLSQVLALVPGLSRSGSTMAGGLLVGLSHEDALRFSFLLATPIIDAAAVLELPQLFAASARAELGVALAGAAAAACGAFFAVRFLVRFFKTKKLTPFAIYCFLAGVAATIFFLAR